MKARPFSEKISILAAYLGVAIGVAGCLYSLWISGHLFLVPRGASIRPMGLAAAQFLTVVITLLLGLPCALIGLSGPKKKLAGIALLFSCLPIPINMFIIFLAPIVRGFSYAG